MDPWLVKQELERTYPGNEFWVMCNAYNTADHPYWTGYVLPHRCRDLDKAFIQLNENGPNVLMAEIAFQMEARA